MITLNTIAKNSLKNIKAQTPAKFNEELKKVKDLLARQRIKLNNIPSAARQKYQKIYDQALALKKAFDAVDNTADFVRGVTKEKFLAARRSTKSHRDTYLHVK